MCIVLCTTAHPSYSLVILNNRDEFILRPTSHPHWWKSPTSNQIILSSRDLQRAEQGTWLGITRSGNFAVLTNYRETDTHDAQHPVQGLRSRGGMVTSWLESNEEETTEHFIHRLLEGDGVKGVGGFSLLCGKLRKSRNTYGEKEIDPLAIISNRAGSPDDVPWIAEKRGEVYGLSNTSFDDPVVWPKVVMGKEKVLAVVEEAVETGMGEDDLVDKLYAVLDANTLPLQDDGEDFEEYIYQLRKSIFIPSIGHAEVAKLPKADQIAAANPDDLNRDSEAELKEEEAPDAGTAMSGIYGTQRQTIILVDWEGNVSFRERSLYDENGNAIERGKGDMKFKFKVEGWNGESKEHKFHPHAVLQIANTKFSS